MPFCVRWIISSILTLSFITITAGTIMNDSLVRASLPVFIDIIGKAVDAAMQPTASVHRESLFRSQGRGNEPSTAHHVARNELSQSKMLGHLVLDRTHRWSQQA